MGELGWGMERGVGELGNGEREGGIVGERGVLLGEERGAVG